MVLCKFCALGKCKYGDRCRFEHVRHQCGRNYKNAITLGKNLKMSIHASRYSSRRDRYHDRKDSDFKRPRDYSFDSSQNSKRNEYSSIISLMQRYKKERQEIFKLKSEAWESSPSRPTLSSSDDETLFTKSVQSRSSKKSNKKKNVKRNLKNYPKRK